MRRARLPLYYAGLASVIVVVAIVVRVLAGDVHAQPDIAGGYEVGEGRACLGGRIDVRQSGQFITLERSDGSTAGRLRFRGGRLAGTVGCSGGTSRDLRATVRGGSMTGAVGARPLRARLADEAPPPGVGRSRAPRSIAGAYRLLPQSECLGGRMRLTGGTGVSLTGSGAVRGRLRYVHGGALDGRVTCTDGARATLTGQAANRELTLTVRPAGAAPERVAAERQRDSGATLAAFFLALVVVVVAARLVGAAAVRIRQPRIMGEVTAGILLGPTAFGALAPDVQSAVFPSDIIPFIGVAANLGLIFYMFLIGLELDLAQLRGRVTQTAVISNTGVAIPMLAGVLVAIPTYGLVGPDKGFTAFALFMGVSMSITAFPVLARILVERRMLKRPLGALALASAAIDDVSAWFLIAVATAVAVAGSATAVLRTVALAALFCALMFLVVRRVLARMSTAYDEAGQVSALWITAILAGVPLAAYATEEIGIALIFGAFVMGAVMPRHAGLTEDVARRMEDFVVLLLLPLFFCYAGLRTDVLLLDRPGLVVLTLGLIAVAIACKFGGTILAARVTGLGWRESSVLGALLNTRGLTELIVLNLALEKGVISEGLFAALVLMAIVTTFMTGPLLNRLDPENRFGAPVDEELDQARRETADLTPIPMPERSILVVPQAAASVDDLVAIAEPLARSEPARELILLRLVAPPSAAAVRGALQTENRLLEEAAAEVRRARAQLLDRHVAARAVAFASPDPGTDLRRLVDRERVDLLLMDGRRPLLGGGVPRGDVGAALEHAACDVAVLVTRAASTIALGPDAPVVVPFGGQEHDWAALELGAWLSSVTGAPLRLLGGAGQTEDGRDASRLLGNASLLVQRFVGVTAEPVLAEGGQQGVLEAAGGAALLIVGLSERWRQEGLGPTRSEIARAAPAPVLFVRRGERAGVLAARGDVTRFTWSSPVVGVAPPPAD